MTSTSFAQNEWMTRDLTNYPFAFLTHRDSIPALYEVKNGIVVIEKDTINLKDSILLYFETREFYGDKIKTYLFYPSNYPKGLYTTLNFCFDRLIQINMYTNKSYYLTNFKIELNRNFKGVSDGGGSATTDSIVNYGDRIVSYGQRYTDYTLYGSNKFVSYQFREDVVKGVGYLILYDKKVSDLMPSWCGTCNGRRTWEKLRKYMEKNVR